MEKNYKATIITVSYNSEKTIKDTIESVLNQTYTNIEYILVDGKSIDSTIDIIKSYEKEAKEKGIIYRWISESDKGIYDAMNKGIEMASGEFIGIINSDDWYELDALENIAREFNQNRKIDIIHGDLVYYKEKGAKKYKPNFTYKRMLFLGMSLYHPTCFVKSSIYKEEKFDINYKLVADYKFIFSQMMKNKKIVYFSKTIAHMRDGGAGTVFWKRILEGHNIRKDLGVNIITVYISTFLRISISILSDLKRIIAFRS